MPLSNLAVRDIETVVHPYTNLAGLRDSGPLVVEHGKGVFIHDSEGKAYIDGMAGLWCVSLGYGNEELVEAAAAQMRKLSFGHLFSAKRVTIRRSNLRRSSRKSRRCRFRKCFFAHRDRRPTTPRSSSSGT